MNAYIVALICWLFGGVLFGLAIGWIWPTEKAAHYAE